MRVERSYVTGRVVVEVCDKQKLLITIESNYRSTQFLHVPIELFVGLIKCLDDVKRDAHGE